MFVFFEYLNHLFHEYMSGVHTKDIPVIVDALFGPTMGQTFEARALCIVLFCSINVQRVIYSTVSMSKYSMQQTHNLHFRS